MIKTKTIIQSKSTFKTPTITVVEGDGIGPEIMQATLRLLEAAGSKLNLQPVVMGEKSYLSGHSAGIAPDQWSVIRKSDAILKAPITTPSGSGYKSLNVTLRKSLGLFANVRPNKSFHPFVSTHFPNADLVIIRENEEDLYAGIEHQQTTEVVQCLKLITRPGCERVVRYAFEYARAHDRKKVTCMVKDNIMKHTDGLFREVFEDIGAQYPDIEKETQIIDIGAAKLATQPERFDVVVTLNLYGDILSDIAAEATGSVGMAGSANIGDQAAMFEAIHGSAPDIAGQGVANPSGLMNAAIMMLVHLGQMETAQTIANAWLKTIEDGIHTPDIYNANYSHRKVNTEDFTTAIIARLGQQPSKLPPIHLNKPMQSRFEGTKIQRHFAEKKLVGVDLFVDWPGEQPDYLGKKLDEISDGLLRLKMITNRGVKVYPNGLPETHLTDHWRCRFISAQSGDEPYPTISKEDLLELMKRTFEAGFDVIKTENLYFIDGKRGFSLGQGE